MPLVGPVAIRGIKYKAAITRGDDLVRIVVEEARKSRYRIRDGDIIILSHTVVAKAFGLTVRLSGVQPGAAAVAIADRLGRSPELVEVVLQEAAEIARIEKNKMITVARSGVVSANSQVDHSNVGDENHVVIAPKNPDLLARKIRTEFQSRGHRVAVILTDTLGRPFRIGEVNFAIGCAGIEPINDLRGKADLFGRILRIKRIAVVDELAASSELVTGSSSEGVIGAIVSGYPYQVSERGVKTLRRPVKKDLFI